MNGASKYGRPLPWEFYEHCATMMIATYVIIVGSIFKPKSTLIVDTWNFEAMFEGPQLPGMGRKGPACAHIMHSNGSNYVIVTGGAAPKANAKEEEDLFDFLDTTEILIVDDYDVSQSRWIDGK